VSAIGERGPIEGLPGEGLPGRGTARQFDQIRGLLFKTEKRVKQKI
jgi:hypothetical protein